ncbi:hypothetical protein B0H21DRAFT_730047 [Amylocystis lapponica]|nr:hypothetical protein B0H21DRAFT_730047 [Amylocystis lapponica]
MCTLLFAVAWSCGASCSRYFKSPCVSSKGGVGVRLATARTMAKNKGVILGRRKMNTRRQLTGTRSRLIYSSASCLNVLSSLQNWILISFAR